MKIIVTYKMPFDTPGGDAQNNSTTIENVTSMVYNSATDQVTITYGASNTTVTYVYRNIMLMFIS